MTEQQALDYIKANYLDIPIKAMARHIGRSQDYVRRRLKLLGLVIPPELAKQRALDGCFKKGNKPHNLGKPQTEWMDEEARKRVAATQYKPGNLPHGAKEADGTLSLWKDRSGYDYYFIRVSLSKWMPYHRYIWEKHNGPIPEGHNIQFKNGNTMDCSLENLYMVSRKEQANINREGGRKIPHELKKVVALQVKLGVALKKLSKSKPNTD